MQTKSANMFLYKFMILNLIGHCIMLSLVVKNPIKISFFLTVTAYYRCPEDQGPCAIIFKS